MDYLNGFHEAEVSSVREFIENGVPEMSEEQKKKINYEHIVKNSPFVWLEDKPKVKVHPLMRILLIPYLVIFLLMVIMLPINFLIVGRWGYSDIIFKPFSRLSWLLLK